MDAYFLWDLSLAQFAMIGLPGVTSGAIVVTRFDIVFPVEPGL